MPVHNQRLLEGGGGLGNSRSTTTVLDANERRLVEVKSVRAKGRADANRDDKNDIFMKKDRKWSLLPLKLQTFGMARYSIGIHGHIWTPVWSTLQAALERQKLN